MYKEFSERNRPLEDVIHPSSGYLVSVTDVFYSTNHVNNHLSNLKKGGQKCLKISAKLTNSNRLYKISSKTKTLSDNSNTEICFDISCFTEWLDACSFINIGDILEIIGGFVSIKEKNVSYEYSNSKRDSSMIVWRKGFEHAPAILTHAAVLCSKGNVYLPAWARIYNDKNSGISEIKNFKNTSATNKLIPIINDNPEGSKTKNSLVSLELGSEELIETSEKSSTSKKRRFDKFKQDPQVYHYSYIEKLSEIVPKVSTNLFGVVLEVGNNPIKRFSTRNTQIFMNVTLIDPSVIELVPIDNYTNTVLESLLSGTYNYSNRPRLNPSLPTISLEIATEGEVNTLPIISLGDIIRVHRVEPTISKQKYIDLPYNFRNTSIRVWSLYDTRLDDIYSKFYTDEDIYNSSECYLTVENAFKVGSTQLRTTFTKEDSMRLLKLQRWVYELFHDFPYFSISPYTKTLSYLSNPLNDGQSKISGDIIVFIHDICLLPEFIKKSSILFDSNDKPYLPKTRQLLRPEILCLIVTEHKYCERITFSDLTKSIFDEIYIVAVFENYNFGLKDYFLNNFKPLSFGDWIRIKNVSILGTDYFSYINDEIIGPFTVININRSRITRLPLWSGDVKLVSNRISPISFKCNDSMKNKIFDLKSNSIHKAIRCTGIDEELLERINLRMKTVVENNIQENSSNYLDSTNNVDLEKIKD